MKRPLSCISAPRFRGEGKDRQKFIESLEIFGGIYEQALFATFVMGKPKSLAQQIAALEEPIPKGLLLPLFNRLFTN